jgi:hypothetical protein
MRHSRKITSGLALCMALGMSAHAAEPEIKRDIGTAQGDDVVHTLRQIPEACTRLEGRFTGDAANPYAMELVRTSPQCQPRAIFMDYTKAQPSEAKGWKLNDIIRTPSASCPQQRSVIHVWRKPAGQAVKLDGQGKNRIYLDDAKKQAAEGKLAALPAYAAVMEVEGKACR